MTMTTKGKLQVNREAGNTYVPVECEGQNSDDALSTDEEGRGRGACTRCTSCFSVGCFWGVIACLYFFIIIPAGVLLILHGHTRGSALTLALGIVLLFIVTCALPGVYLGYRYRTTMRKVELTAVRSSSGYSRHHRTPSDTHHSLTKNIVADDDCVTSSPA